MYARGLSTRDIEAVFAEAEARSLLSRTAVSEVTERLWAQRFSAELLHNGILVLSSTSLFG